MEDMISSDSVDTGGDHCADVTEGDNIGHWRMWNVFLWDHVGGPVLNAFIVLGGLYTSTLQHSEVSHTARSTSECGSVAVLNLPGM